jgi:hypothetical protein
MIQKTAWRYMQYNPELYPAQDFKFVASSSLGLMAREYETTQLVQLMQTMPQDNPVYPMIIEAIVENMNLAKREEMLAAMRQARQPSPEQQQAAQQQQQLAQQQAQLAIAKDQATAEALKAQAAEAQARAGKYTVESQVEQYNAETQRIKAVSTNLDRGDADDKEFEKRMKLAELTLKTQRQNADIAEKSSKTAENVTQAFNNVEQIAPQQPMPPINTDNPEGQ